MPRPVVVALSLFTRLAVVAVAAAVALAALSSQFAASQTLDSIRPAGYYTRERMLEIRAVVRENFEHAFKGYMEYAFPMDELKPISCKGTDHFGRYSMTAIDTLDTLALMGDYRSFFRLAEHIVDNVRFGADMSISVFETTIRVLGGLTTAHDIAVKLRARAEERGYDAVFGAGDTITIARAKRYDGGLLRAAVDAADRMTSAFDTPTGIPFNEVNMMRGAPEPAKGHATCPAAAGSLLLEFGYLSHLTGNCTYLQLARQALLALWKHRSPHNLVGTMIDIYSGFWINTEANIGASVDSFYEYMVKAYIVSGDRTYLDMWETSSRSIYKHTLFTGWYLSSSVEFRGPMENFEHRFNSLQTFWPGLQALAGDVQGAIHSFEKTHCVSRSLRFPPEYLAVGEYVTRSQNPKKSGPGYPLRPEVIESAYYLHRATQDDYFLNVGEHFLTHLGRARTRCGYAAILDVWQMTLEDKMESFLLSETFKYLYLLFTPPKWKRPTEANAQQDDDDRAWLFSLDEGFVVNTEAHVVPISRGMRATYQLCSQEAKLLPQMQKSLLDDDFTAHNRDDFEVPFPEFRENLVKRDKHLKKKTASSAASSGAAASAKQQAPTATTKRTAPSLSDPLAYFAHPVSLNPDLLTPHERAQCPALDYMRDIAPRIDALRSRDACYEFVDTAVLANKMAFYGVPREMPQPRPIEITMPDGSKARISPAALAHVTETLRRAAASLGAAAGGAGLNVGGTAGIHVQGDGGGVFSQQQHDQVQIEVPADELNPLSNPLRLTLAVPQRLRNAAASVMSGLSSFGGVVAVPSFASMHMLYIQSSETVVQFRFSDGAQAGFLTGRAVFAPSLCHPKRSDRRALSGPLLLLTSNRLCDAQAEAAARQMVKQQFGDSDDPAVRANVTAAALRFGVMVRRGECTFKEKIQRAQRIGARFVIVYNDNSQEKDGVLEMADVQSPLTDVPVNVPAVFITRTDAERIVQYQLKSEKINSDQQQQQDVDETDTKQQQQQQPLTIEATLRCAATVVEQFEAIGVTLVESKASNNIFLAPARLRPVAEMLRDKAARDPSLRGTVSSDGEEGSGGDGSDGGYRCEDPSCVLLLSYVMNDEGVPPWRVIKGAVERAAPRGDIHKIFSFQVGPEPPVTSVHQAATPARPAHYGVNGILMRTANVGGVLSTLGLSRALTYVLQRPWVYSAAVEAARLRGRGSAATDSESFNRDGDDDGENDGGVIALSQHEGQRAPALLRIEIVNLADARKGTEDEFLASEAAIQSFLRSATASRAATAAAAASSEEESTTSTAAEGAPQKQQEEPAEKHGVVLRFVGEDPERTGRFVVVTAFDSEAAARSALVSPSPRNAFTQLSVLLLRQRMNTRPEVMMEMRQRVGLFENFGGK